MGQVIDFKKKNIDNSRLSTDQQCKEELENDYEKRQRLSKMATDSFISRRKAVQSTKRISVLVFVIIQLLSTFVQVVQFSPFLFLIQIAMTFAFFYNRKICDEQLSFIDEQLQKK